MSVPHESPPAAPAAPAPDAPDDLLAAGLVRLRAEFAVPGDFPAEVLAEAEEAARRGPLPAERLDLTADRFVTLDPASSTDLDQAFALHAEGDVIVLRYAIADVSAWVVPGGALEAEAWRRGVTRYLPDFPARLYPPVLSEAAASLLPDGPRPAVVLTVEVGMNGHGRLRSAQRAMIHSRAKLAYDALRPEDVGPLFKELGRRGAVAEDARGATRIDLPEQELEADPSAPGGLRLRLRQRLDSEDRNAALSLVANIAAAKRMVEAGAGLLRTMPDPDDRVLGGLRRTARGLGIDWPDGMSLRALTLILDPADPRQLSMLMAARRGSSATYEPVGEGVRPWHAAVASEYAHLTAPLRRLADRYLLDLLVDLDAGRIPTEEQRALFARLAPVMEDAETAAGRADRAVLDLVEAVILDGREGETFRVVVVEPPDRQGRATVLFDDPPVRTRVKLPGAEPGEVLEVRLDAAEPTERRLVLSRLGPVTASVAG